MMTESPLVGNGYVIRQEGRFLNIQIDTEAVGEPSKSGKSIIVAGSGGFLEVGGLKIQFNAIRMLPKAGKAAP